MDLGKIGIAIMLFGGIEAYSHYRYVQAITVARDELIALDPTFIRIESVRAGRPGCGRYVSEANFPDGEAYKLRYDG